MRGPSSASRALLLALMLAGCARNTSTASTGEPIDTGKACARASDCQSGDCLLLANGESVCTTACSSTSQCVAGWKCEGLPLQRGHLCACDPSPEVCDGLDNDCNGLVDDGAAPDEQCSQKTAGFSCVNGACGCALMCGGRCVSPDWDSANCGACGQICPGETGCVDGVCGCGPGKTRCGDLCANLLGSPPNCGACGHACPTGDICSNSECVCPIDEVDCDGVCSNLTFDSGNCGGCGNKCEPDLFCADGQCTCRPPLASCAGTCVDLSIDALNCGACGQACASVAGTSATCLAGRCTGTVASAD